MSKRRQGGRIGRTAESKAAEASLRAEFRSADSAPEAIDAPAPRDWTARAVVAAPAIAALALYVATLAPTVATGDSGELTTAAITLGLAHPPGYPTFTLLGHVIGWLPFGDAAHRVNLLSAILDALAVLVATLIAGRLIGLAAGREWSALGWVAAAIAGLSLAISTGFWRYALVAEVFALSNLLALAVLGLMLEWSRRPDRMRLLYAAAAAAGLALTNQQTIIFAAPALLILLGIGLRRYTARAPGRRVGRPYPWRGLAIAVAFGSLGLLPYLYLPLAAVAGAETPWGDPRTIGGFLGIVTRSAYGTFSFTVRETSGSPIEHIALFFGYLVDAFTLPGLLLAAVGGAWLATRRAGEAVALGVWVLVAGPVFLVIANPPLSDPVTRGVLERFYLLPSLPVALAIGAGAWAIVSWLTQVASSSASVGRALGLAALAGILVGLGALAVIRYPEVDASDNRVAETYADDILTNLPPNTLLLMRSDENYTSITYAQAVRGIRPDVVAIDVELLKIPAYVAQIEAAHPDVDVPFAAYDGGDRTSLGDLIDNVRDVRPVFLVGQLEEDLSAGFDLVDEGLAERILPGGDEPDPLSALRANPAIFDGLHPPARSYPESTWEAAIIANYADVAFKTGVALQTLGPQDNAPQIERLYRAAIRLTPSLASAYKNLGLLLQANEGPASEIIAVWERYLELRPDDPEAGVIRAAVDRLRENASPAPTP